MIDCISIDNFKSLKRIKELKFKPITVICGPNSCGKSSLIDSVLFLKQNTEGRHTDRILYNGEYSHLANYRNVVFGHDENQDIYLEYYINCVRGPMMPPELRPTHTVKYHRKIAECGIKLEIRLSNKEPEREVPQREYSFISEYKITVEGVEDCNSYIELKKQEDGFLLSYEIQDNNKPYGTFQRTGILVHSLRLNGFLIDHRDLLYMELAPHICDSRKNRDLKAAELEAFQVHHYISRINELITRSTGSLIYMGPLRESPSRRYLYENAIENIGITGSNAASVFHAERDVSYKSLYFYDNKIGQFKEEFDFDLDMAVKYWMDYLGVKSFGTYMNEQVLQVSLKDTNTGSIDVSLADVGFGISQVFPIILEGIRMGVGSTLILEQPEIHLHPKLQMQIADYIICMALSSRNFIVETHSDHFINRLVRRIVEDEEGLLNDLIQIYFVTPSKEGAVFNEIEIDETKGIVNWPDGFFDQAANEQELIIRAGLDKRKKRRANNIKKKD